MREADLLSRVAALAERGGFDGENFDPNARWFGAREEGISIPAKNVFEYQSVLLDLYECRDVFSGFSWSEFEKQVAVIVGKKLMRGHVATKEDVDNLVAALRANPPV